MRLAHRRLGNDAECLAGHLVVEQLGGCLVFVPSYLCKEAQPQYSHFLFGNCLGLEFGQFHKYEAKALDASFGMLGVDYGVVVVELVGTAHEAHVVHQTEAVDRLDEAVVLAAVELLHHCLGGVEDHALLEVGVPVELHLDDELPPLLVVAAHIYDAVFLAGVLGHHLGCEVFHAGYLPVGL